MGLPIVDEIFAGIRWIIDFFLNKAPKPVLFLFFLLLLFLFSAFISFTFHLIGIHCTSTGDVVKVSPLKVGSNINLAFIGANEPFDPANYTPQPITVGEGVISLIGNEVCFRKICFGDDGEYHYSIESDCDNKTIITPYKMAKWSWLYCSVCNGTVNSTFISGIFGASETIDLCFGNTEPLDDDDKNFYQEHFCEPESQCTPPDDYYYDYAQNLYICSNPTVCNQSVNSSSPITKADHVLLEANAELLYPPNMNKKDINSAILFKCDKQGSAAMTFFGVPVFDYRIWMLLGVIFGMLVGLNYISQHGSLK